jgi:hypothetical protein
MIQKMTKNATKTKYLRFALAAALAAGLTLPLCTTARADHDWRDDCHERLRHDKERIDRDAARFGPHSRAVDHDVDRLERTRQWCRDHHADWDHSQFDVGIYVHPH